MVQPTTSPGGNGVVLQDPWRQRWMRFTDPVRTLVAHELSEVIPVLDAVESAVNVVWRGRTLMTPIGGGVTIQPLRCLEPSNVLPDDEKIVEMGHSMVDLSNAPADRWWWD